MLQASLRGYKAIGYDINPLALLISHVKTTKFQLDDLLDDFNKFKRDTTINKYTDIPNIKNIDYWYEKEVQNLLGRIRFVLKNYHYKYKNLFIICYAFICRSQSFTRNGEFKRYRIEASKIESFKNEVFDKLYSNIQNAINIISSTAVPKENVLHLLKSSEEQFDDNLKYDLVITSPPYGDSRTTVAYGEFSSFGMDWTNDLNEFGSIDYNIDKESVGKKQIINKEIFNSKLLINLIEKIESIDEKRAKDVLYFFNGYFNVLRNVTASLNSKGRLCFIVGNRIVKGVPVEMDQITADFFTDLGMIFEAILVRDISNKVMPIRNSPTNRIGITESTMNKEYIVIFNKA